MKLSIKDRLRLGMRIWYRVTHEAMTAGLLIGGVLYGGLILPFGLTVRRQFDNFFGVAFVGLIVSIPTSILLAFATALVSGLIIAIFTISRFFPLHVTKLYIMIIGAISIASSVVAMNLVIMLFREAPYYAYNNFYWNGSDIVLTLLAGYSGGWAIYRFVRWYSKEVVLPTL